MDISDLETFVQVAASGSFSQAAEQLFITQSAVSKRIASLENELQEPLFDRVKRRVRLTEAGRALLPHAQAILGQLNDGKRAIQQLSEEVSGRLSIATSHHIGLHRLPPLLKQFTQDYPQVELDLHFMDSEEACTAVADGQIELGIVTLPLSPSKNLLARLVWRDRLELVVAHNHPLAQARIQPQALSDYPAILPAKATYTRQILETALRPLNVQLNTRLSTNYLETIKMMVSVGLGWSVLPASMIGEELHILRMPGLKLQRRLGTVQHRRRTLSNAALALLAEIRKMREKE